MPKFTLPRDTLLSGLQSIGGAVDKRGTLPVLTHVLMAWRGDTLRLTGTDLEIQMVAEVPADGPEYAICVPFEKLLGICKLLPAKIDLSLEFGDDKAILKGGKSRHTLAILPAENFPEFPTDNETQRCALPINLLAAALGQTLYAAAVEDVRHYLKGVMFGFTDDSLTLVASDGHRLAIHESAQPAGFERQIIVPRKSAQELAKLLGVKGGGDGVSLFLAPTLMRVKFESGLEFSTKLIEGRFPDYQRLLPREILPPMVMDRDSLLGALARAMIPLSGEKFKTISLSHDGGGEFKIKATGKDGGGEADERIDVVYASEVADFGVNASYVVDVLNAIGTARVRLMFEPGRGQLVIRGDMDGAEDRHLIMGVRL